MGAYILRRLALMIPTIIGIMGISFLVIQFAPGGPVEQVVAQLTGQGDSASDRLSGGGDLVGQSGGFDESGSKYRGAQGLDPELIAKLEKQFGFDKPPLTRFLEMMWNYIRFDFGDSFFRNSSVIDLIIDKLPVSASLGFWILIISYIISIPSASRKPFPTVPPSMSGLRASSSLVMRCRASSSASCSSCFSLADLSSTGSRCAALCPITLPN